MPPGANFSTVLTQMYDDQQNCDVNFICPENKLDSSDKSTIGAHKLILSIASEVFNTMFYGSMAQNQDSPDPNNIGTTIDIPDIKISTFKLLLGFIYGKTITFENIEEASEFYYAADKYICKDALDFVSNYMIEEMNAKNCIFIYESTFLYNNEKLKQACKRIFCNYTNEIITNAEFLSANPKTIGNIFQSKVLDITSEMDLIKALERYIYANKYKDSEVGKSVRPAINLIRFLTLKSNEIAQTSLLTSEEIENVIACLPPKEDMSKMPRGLSVCKNKRNFIKIDKIRALNEVFSSRFCPICASSTIFTSSNHAIWNCTNADNNSAKEKLSEIFNKYNHTLLTEYDINDVQTVFNIYKGSELLQSN